MLVASSVTALEHFTLNGSIRNPAESRNPGMLTAGGAPWSNTDTIYYKSNRGPTPDGRIKPDIVGANGVRTATDDHFGGTSSAQPHIAGLAALVRQRFPHFTPQQTAQYLKDNAEPRGEVPNNTWGYGFAKLPLPDGVTPMPVFVFPPNMPQDRQDAYRDYFVAMHEFSQSRFGARADISALQVIIEDRACDSPSYGNPIILGDCIDDRGLFSADISESIAEEYFHFLRDSSPFEAPDWTTLWMAVGSAEYFAALWLDHHGEQSYDDFRAAWLSDLSRVGNPTPLGQTTSRTDPGLWPMAFLAIDYLAEQTGASKPIDYFVAARNSPPAGFAEHFQSVFGISPAAFYDYFAAHRAAGFPQPGAPFDSPTAPPTHTPTATPTHTPVATPVTGGDTQSRLSELERQMGVLQQLLQNLQSLIQALTNRVTALEGGTAPVVTPPPTATPTATPSPTPTSAPGTDPTPVTTPVTDNACIQNIEQDSLIAGTSIAGTWTTACLTANPPPDGDTYYAKFYTFALDDWADLEFIIASASDDGPYIYLMAGEGTDGEVIDHFGVESGVLDAIISLQPGSYTLEVTTWGSGVTGDFDLWLGLRPGDR